MGDHRDALIGPRRAAERVRRRHHHEGTALRHRLDPGLQQLYLRAGFPGVRHGVLGFDGIAGHTVIFDVDAGRQHQLVVAERRTGRQRHRLAGGIDRGRPVMHDVHAIFGGQRVVAVSDGRIVAETAEIEVGKEAGVIALRALDQGDVDRPLAVLGEIARQGGAPRSAADDHHPRLALSEPDRRRCQRCHPDAARRQELPSVECHSSPPWIICRICKSPK